LVQARLKRALRFPEGAGRATGEAHVRFLVHADGSVSDIQIVRSAGSPVLDEAAVATVPRAAPFPPIPASAGRSSWSFTVPLQFRR
jgi:protein TonB